jgi:hypothetical protein
MNSTIPAMVRFLLVPLFLFTASSGAQVTVESFVDKSEITIGDRITYTLAVEYPESLKVEMPGTGAHLGIFEQKDFKDTVINLGEGRLRGVQKFVISTFTTGTYYIPPFPIIYGDSAGPPKMIMSDRISIHVKSLRSDEQKDISDIKIQARLKRSFKWLWLLVSAFLVFGAIICVTAILIRRRKRAKQVSPPLPAHEAALRALSSLREKNFLEQKKFKEYYFGISEIFRRYLGARYGFYAVESTSQELIQEIEDIPISKDQRLWIHELCGNTDIVKYADNIPETTGALKITEDIINFIEQTREKPREDVISTTNSRQEESKDATVDNKDG